MSLLVAITETSPYLLGNFRKFILKLIFTLVLNIYKQYFIYIKTYIN